MGFVSIDPKSWLQRLKRTEGQDVKSTTIEQVFRYQILLIRISGGLMFNWPNKFLALSYRISMITFRIYFTKRHSKLRRLANSMIPDHTRDIVLLYSTLGSYVGYFSLAYSVFIELRHHDILPILLNKRLDKRYYNPSGDKRSDWSTPNISLFKSAFFIVYITYAIFLVISIETSKSVGLCKQPIVKFSNQTKPSRLLPNCYTSFMFQQSGSWMMLVAYVPRFAYSLLVATMTSTLNLSEFDGLILVQLMITASMADMLKQVNEQNGLEAGRSQGEFPKDGLKSNRKLVVPTNNLLVQVRDSLIIMRQAFNFNYVLVYARQLAGFMMNQGLIMSLTSANLYWLSFVLFGLVLIMFFKVLIYRLIHQRLHGEAEEIALTNQSHLIERRHVETIIGAELARSISQIWPTNWIESDIKSYLATNLSIFVLVVGIHQIMEKSLKAEQSRNYE